MNSNEKLGPDTVGWDTPVPKIEVARPGFTPFY